MRALAVLLPLILAACSQADETASNQSAAVTNQVVGSSGTWGAGRDRLCVREQRAGLVTYAESGDANCMIKGASTAIDGGFQLKPDGDTACTIDIRTEGAATVLGRASPACAYYCGPNASYAGKRLEPTTQPSTDLAGDPLC